MYQKLLILILLLEKIVEYNIQKRVFLNFLTRGTQILFNKIRGVNETAINYFQANELFIIRLLLFFLILFFIIFLLKFKKLRLFLCLCTTLHLIFNSFKNIIFV